MKRQVIILVLTGTLCLINQYAFSQISEGGEPVSFSLDIENIPVLIMPPIDIETLRQEDEEEIMENFQRPFRFGSAIDVNIDVKESGLQIELPEGNLWLLKIHCPDAFSINLIYSQFRLGEGSKFFVYNEDRTMILGAFTSEVSNNRCSDSRFATDLVQGNTIVLEYYELGSSNNGVIHISKVIHGYIDIFASNGLGTSADCNWDVMCRPFGNGWVNEERAVVMILVNDNTAFCTGCLVNNTKQDFTPYILTARHCYFKDNGNTQSKDPTTNIFRFQYWRPNCGSGNPITTRHITGATLIAHNASTDFALLKLKQTPPENWNVHYAGWDRRDIAASGVIGIHHPKGDAMKISYDWHLVFAQNHPIQQNFSLSTWKVQHFEEGTIQPGSSGSPLFNQNNKIVGQLSTAPSCENNNSCACVAENRNGNYGRFDLSWTGGGTKETRLRDWLDPNNTVTILEGISFPPCTSTVNFTNQTVTTNQTVSSQCNIYVKNVTVRNNAKLVLDAFYRTTIEGPFEVQLGSALEIK